MEFKHSEVNVCNYNKKLRTTCPVEADIIVPDVMPDVYKILSVNAVCLPGELNIKSGRITFDGEIQFNIMYIAQTDKSKILNIEYSAPFNHQCDIDADDSCPCVADFVVTSTDCKIKNSRKISAKASVSTDVIIYSYEMINTLHIPDDDFAPPYKSRQISADSMIVSRNHEFDLSENVMLPASGGNINIHDLNVRIDRTDIKTVNNKAIIKLTMPATVFYSSGSEYSSYETEFSVTEIADLDMVNSDCILSSKFNVSRVDFSLSDSESDVSLDIDIRIKGYIRAFEEKVYTLIDSIYSPDYSYKLDKVSGKTEKITILPDTQITVKDTVAGGSSIDAIGKIHYMSVYPSYDKASLTGSSVKVNGSIQTIVIYTNDTGELCSIKKDIPYETDIAADNIGSDTIFDVAVTPVSYGYILGSQNEVQARTLIKISVCAYCNESVSIITDFSEDNDTPIDKSSQPSIKVYYPQSGCTLWDLAMKYNTTCEEIAAVNNMDITDTPKIGKPILVPKRQRL